MESCEGARIVEPFLNTRKARSLYTAPIQGILTRLEKELGDAEEIEPYVRVCIDMVELYREKLDGLRASATMGYSIKKGVLSCNVDDFKEVVPVLRNLRSRGYRCRNIQDNPASKSREWHLSLHKEGVTAVSVEAVLKTGATCNFVQVGVKEEPVFELRCGGKKPPNPESIAVPTELR